MPTNVKKIGGVGRSDLVWFEPEDLVIPDDPAHPLYDERATLEPSRALIDNIKTYGIIQPVVVRFNPAIDKTEIISGRQRVKAARIAKSEQAKAGEVTVRVPAIIKKHEDRQSVGIMVSENEQRRADTVVTKARKAARMVDMGCSVSDIATAFGVSMKTVYGWQSKIGPQKSKETTAKKKSAAAIKKALSEVESSGETTKYNDGYKAALLWVLGQ